MLRTKYGLDLQSESHLRRMFFGSKFVQLGRNVMT